jgi:hypothetical protein
MPFFERGAVENLVRMAPLLPANEQALVEPVLVMVYAAHVLHARLRLGDVRS